MRSTTCDDLSLTVQNSNDPYHWYLKNMEVSISCSWGGLVQFMLVSNANYNLALDSNILLLTHLNYFSFSLLQ